MTTTTTTTKTIITVKKNDLRKNIADQFKDMITSCYTFQDVEDIENMQTDLNRLTDCLEQIDNGLLSNVFADGYTMMLLSFKDFETVEEFFHENSNNDNMLEIHVTDETGNVIEVVKHDYLSY
jgi:hypothetical protein